MKQPMIDTMTRPKFDNLFTPEKAVKPLIDIFWEYFYKAVIWEPCDPGNSGISKALRSMGYRVISTDISTGFDFLKDTPDFNFHLIVTNPPYSQKDKFIERCLSYKCQSALLLPLTTLEGIKRGKIFDENCVSVIVLDKRLDFTGKGSCWFNTSWFFFSEYESKLYFKSLEES